MDEERAEVYGFPAAVRLVQPANRDELGELARARANDPTIFDELDPFFWAAIISNTRLDSYWTHMARSTLDNFARGAIDGVSFQNSHRWMELPLGASLTGRVEELDSGLVQVVSDFYTLVGLQLNELSTDQFIRGVRSGVVKDVSVGFSGGHRICDICGNNYLDYMRCPHFAGKVYEIEEHGVVRQVRATVTIEEANLNEVSAVYDGATPGAVILKARSAAADGRLRGKEAEVLEQLYRVALPVTQRYAGVDVTEPPKSSSQKEGRTMGLDAILDKHQIGSGLEEVARAAALDRRLGELVTAETTLVTVREELAAAQARVAELEPAAADGEQYRSDLIEEALAEGVRAKGDAFDQEKYGELLRSPAMTIERIKLMRDDWQANGNARFPGGRHTHDEHERGDKQQEQRARVPGQAPDHAYAV